MSDNESTVTPGIATFLNSENPNRKLFRIEPGIPVSHALEQASELLACVRKLTLLGVTDDERDLIWAAHYLNAMAKALVDDACEAKART